MRDPQEAALLQPLWVVSTRKSNLKILFTLPAHAAQGAWIYERAAAYTKAARGFVANSGEKTSQTLVNQTDKERERDGQANTKYNNNKK